MVEEVASVTTPREAEGYKLHLSSRSASGYKGVTWNKTANKFYCANYKQDYLGTFDTAVEAAVAHAKAVEAADAMEEEEEVDDVEDPALQGLP